MTTDFVRRRPNTQIENLRIGNYDFHSYREHFKTSLKDVLKLWIKSHIQGVFTGTPGCYAELQNLRIAFLMGSPIIVA